MWTHNHSKESNGDGSMQITNYDVLIDGGKETAFQLVDTEHVGNKRFEVFLNLHKEEYEKADEEGKDHTVAKLIDIVCHKCIPNGRFLEKVAIPIEGESEWMEIGEGELARRRVHQALAEVVMGRMPDRSSKVFTKQERKNDAADSKRRRRGSYAHLRRSISESMMFHSTLEQINSISNTINYDSVEDSNVDHNTLAWASLTRAPDVSLSNNLLKKSSVQQVVLQPMDVVLSARRISLAPTGNPGNARFGILVSMHADNFVAAAGNNDERREILDELMTAVQTHWKGRFLVTILDGYELLPKPAVSAWISGLMLKVGDAAGADSVQSNAESPHEVIVDRPLSPLPYCNTPKRALLNHEDSDMPAISGGSHSHSGHDVNSLNNQPVSYLPDRIPTGSSFNSDRSLVPDLNRLSFYSSTSGGSTSAIAAGGNPAMTDKMRIAAVESLKAKKKKRDVMKRVMERTNSAEHPIPD